MPDSTQGQKTVAIACEIVACGLEIVAPGENIVAQGENIVPPAENIVAFARDAVANAQMMGLGGSIRLRGLPRWMRLAERWAVADFWRRDVTRYCRDLIKCGREGAGGARDRVAWGRDLILDAAKSSGTDPWSPNMLAHPSEVLALGPKSWALGPNMDAIASDDLAIAPAEHAIASREHEHP